jgi:hypothetical protein
MTLPIIGCCLESGAGGGIVEKRNEPRVRQRLAVRYGEGKRFYLSHTYDISENGIFIMAPDVFPVGTILELEVEKEDRRFAFTGEVKWSRQVERAVMLDLKGGMGIRLADSRDPAFARLLCESEPAIRSRFRQEVAVCLDPRELFQGSATLSVKTSAESQVFINGLPAGFTRNCFLTLKNVAAGHHQIEARTESERAAAAVELKKEDVRLLQLELVPFRQLAGDAALKALSQIGPYVIVIDGQEHLCPARIEKLAPGKRPVLVRVDGIEFMPEIELLAGKSTEFELTLHMIAEIFHLKPGIEEKL